MEDSYEKKCAHCRQKQKAEKNHASSTGAADHPAPCDCPFYHNQIIKN